MDLPIEVARSRWQLRNGNANPELVENPFWDYMIRTRRQAYWARQKFKKIGGNAGGGTSQLRYTDPVWCFTRLGRTVTQLPDGRIVYIAGEHEDSYDPDFCIYSDVVVEDTSGNFEIYLYPDELFPPTDFHSATLVGETVWLIGSVGYKDWRSPGETQVFKLDTRTFAISAVETFGCNPGWVSGHAARLRDDNRTIEVTGGRTLFEGHGPNDFVALQGQYQLDLSTSIWTKGT
jgi:hypothetical protein